MKNVGWADPIGTWERSKSSRDREVNVMSIENASLSSFSGLPNFTWVKGR